MSGDFRQPEVSIPAEGLPVVAFDFDGTLTCSDSFVAFFRWRAGLLGFAVGVGGLAPDIAAHMLKPDRGKLKAAMARRFLGPIRRRDLDAETARFAQSRAADLFRPDAVACWHDWRRRGARLLIVTASPEVFVAPFAALLGADGLIGTRLAFDGEDRFAGVLEGLNCRGPEKVVRLRAALGDDLQLEAAYGDSDGDTEMLAFARTAGLKVFTARP